MAGSPEQWLIPIWFSFKQTCLIMAESCGSFGPQRALLFRTSFRTGLFEMEANPNAKPQESHYKGT